MQSPFNQSTQGFFSSTGDESLNPEENMRFNYRGKDVYNKVTSNTPRAPYVKNQGTNKKFPYLSSKHHTGDVYNPMQTSIRNTSYPTIAEERKLAQDNMIQGNFVEEGQGTRGSTFFGRPFDKTSEKDAKQAVERHEYLVNAASQGENELNAALSKENIVNKNGVVIGSEMPVKEKFPMKSGYSSVTAGKNPQYTNAPAGQSFRNINQFEDLRDRAYSAQNLVDSNRRIGGELKEFMSNRKPFTFSTEFDPKSGM